MSQTNVSFINDVNGKLFMSKSGQMIVLGQTGSTYIPLPVSTPVSASAIIPVAPKILNPAPFFIQTLGDDISTVVTSGINTIESITANSKNKFIPNTQVGSRPTLINAPDLKNAKVLYFNGASCLDLNMPVPSNFLGSSPRSIYILMKISTPMSRNVFGYGSNAYTATFDLLQYGNSIGLHWYGGRVYSLVYTPVGSWVLFRVRYDGANIITNHMNDTNSSQYTPQLNTGTVTTFRLGLGNYNGYNSEANVTIAHLEAYPYFTTLAQDQAIVSRINKIYGTSILP